MNIFIVLWLGFLTVLILYMWNITVQNNKKIVKAFQKVNDSLKMLDTRRFK